MSKDQCYVCKKTDADDKEDEDLWIVCSTVKCAQWYHVHCAGLGSSSLETPWYCNICTPSTSFQKPNEHQNVTNQNCNNPGNNGLQNSAAIEKENELKILTDLIREKEELYNLKMKQLNIMEQMSNQSKISVVRNWVQNCEREQLNGGKANQHQPDNQSKIQSRAANSIRNQQIMPQIRRKNVIGSDYGSNIRRKNASQTLNVQNMTAGGDV